MSRSRKKFRRGRLAGLCCFFGILLAYHLAWNVIPGMVAADFHDPQYHLKEVCLRDQLAKNPGRPLWLVMGSSRVEDELAAGMLDTGSGSLVFNFGMGGADLFRQYVCLRRLLEIGIKPQRVGIELMYPTMGHEESLFISDPTLICRARWNETPVYREYSKDPGQFSLWWWRSRLDPYFIQHNVESRRLISDGLSKLKHRKTYPYHEWGWLKGSPPVFIPQQLDVLFEAEKKRYTGSMSADYQVTPRSDKVLRQIFSLCKSEGIDIFLIGMPESPRFQALYAPEANEAAQSYVERIKAEFAVPVIDARSWIRDEYMFGDGHHLLEPGEREFTRRFRAELLKLPPLP